MVVVCRQRPVLERESLAELQVLYLYLEKCCTLDTRVTPVIARSCGESVMQLVCGVMDVNKAAACKAPAMELIGAALQVSDLLLEQCNEVVSVFASTFVTNAANRAWLESYAKLVLQPDERVKDMLQQQLVTFVTEGSGTSRVWADRAALWPRLMRRMLVHYRVCVEQLQKSSSCAELLWELLAFLIKPDDGILPQLLSPGCW